MEGWVLVAGDGRRIPTWSRDTVDQGIYEQVTGDSGGVGVPIAYFSRL